MNRNFQIWDGDGLPDTDEEIADLLAGDLGFTQPEMEGLLDAVKKEAWVNEKIAKYEKDADKKEWYLTLARYYWRRAERLRKVIKDIMSNVDEELQLKDNIISSIKNEANKRDSIAYDYGWLLQSKHSEYLDWEAINQAIVDRWSKTTLKYIKTKAWKIVEDNATT